LKVHKKVSHARARKTAYLPIEDQLDAVIKCLAHLGNNGIDIGADIQPIIDHHNNVKTKFPKKGKD